jgi:hypothetical protein
MSNEGLTIDFCFQYGVFCSVIAAVLQMPHRTWRWKVNLKMFEALHGMSRVVRLIPDKLVTVQDICKLHEPTESIFLIELILDLVKRYALMASEKQISNATLEDVVSITICPVMGQIHDDRLFDTEVDQLDFYQTVDLLRTQLENLIEQLRTREDSAHQITEILNTADGISAATECFVHFTHPAIIQVARRLSSEATKDQCESVLLENLTDSRRAAVVKYSAQFITRMYEDLLIEKEDET